MAPLLLPTILLADDSEDNRYVVRRHLEKAGFQVMETTSGEDTLRLAQLKPDLIILEVDLPDMTGFEVCRRLKTATATMPIPVLHLSATFTLAQHRVQGLEGGADAYLCHPVEPLELVATVNALLRARRAEQALRDADRRKDEFLAMLAHELRNPLAPIRTAVEVLKLMDGEDSPMSQAREIVDRQVAHMSRLIDDLLDVSRIARGKVALQRQRCNFGRITRDTVDDYRATLEAERLRLTVHIPDRPAWVSGDCTRLAQVVGNLLHNARKFTNPGGQVGVQVAVEAETVVLTVQDTGIGIDEDTLPHIFEPFSQADRSLDRSRGGLGLGLALVKGLVELHGGDVQAVSEGVGKGCCFTVRLPVNETDDAPDPEAPFPVMHMRPFRMLVIEDNVDAALSLKMLFGLMGHEAQTAHTGAEGLAAAESFKPDLILCDIGLPGGVDGFAVAAALRKKPELRDAYLVAVTGYGQLEDRNRTLEAGFDMHLTKPIDGAAIDRVLAVAAGRRLTTGRERSQ